MTSVFSSNATILTSGNSQVVDILSDYPLLPAAIEKTSDMEDIEWEFKIPNNSAVMRKDIRILMLEALANYPTQRDAANSLNLYPPTFSHWLRKLAIITQAREIRKLKKSEKLLKIA